MKVRTILVTCDWPQCGASIVCRLPPSDPREVTGWQFLIPADYCPEHRLAGLAEWRATTPVRESP
jgi:hypothetical protein